jgi:hypothetical protein
MITLVILKARRVRMVAYLALKVEEQDWHGVADAAMDLREIDAMLRMVTKPNGEDV